MVSELEPGATILVADDDPLMRLMSVEHLEEHGYTVVEAENGLEAFDVSRECSPDLILLDVQMPKLDGFDVCSRLRQTSECSHVPVVMVTGLDDKDAIRRAYEAGATDFIAKPVNFAILTHRVKYILRSHANVQALRRHELQLANVQRIAKLGYWKWDSRSERVTWTEEALEISGQTLEQACESLRSMAALLDPGERTEVRAAFVKTLRSGQPLSLEHRLQCPDGSQRVVHHEVELSRPANGSEVELTGVLQDITERRRTEEKIFRLTNYDDLTGLPNRKLLLERLALCTSAAQSHGSKVAILALGLDRFRNVNDSLGHRAGDRLIVQVAERLGGAVRRGMPPYADLVAQYRADAGAHDEMRTLARLDGDQFLLVLSPIDSSADAARAASRVLAVLDSPFDVDGTEVALTGSMGIILYPDDARTPADLLTAADNAMRRAKVRGRNNYAFFSQGAQEESSRHLRLETAVRSAIDEGEFCVYYQPKVQADTGRVVGLEALLRWPQKDGSFISPTEFIPIAEDLGAINRIGKWVMLESCRQLKCWADQGFDLTMSVNLSPAQFLDSALPADIEKVIHVTNVDPGKVEFELTESVLVNDFDSAMSTMNRLRALGVLLAIDDFGTGYSSLSYLRQFPFDVLKIDRSFVDEVAESESAAAIVHGIVHLAHVLGMYVVAEGVETEAQAKVIRAAKCEAIQGFLYARPMPAEEVTPWLRNNCEAHAQRLWHPFASLGRA